VIRRIGFGFIADGKTEISSSFQQPAPIPMISPREATWLAGRRPSDATEWRLCDRYTTAQDISELINIPGRFPVR
jgi:hypothetical protein